MAIDYFKIGQISGKQFTDVTGAVEKGLEAGFKPLVEWKKKRDKFDADYARLLQSTPNIDNLPELPSNYLPKASEWLISKQQEYAANARTTIKARPGSPEYQQAVMNMNNIKSSVANLKSTLTGINTERKEFLKSKEIGEISLGFQNADIYEAYGPNGAITAIDANGNVALTGDGGKSFNWNERQEFFNKSGGVQKDLFLAGDISLKEGEAGKQRNVDYYTEQSKAIVAQYDLPKIKSLVFDDLDGTDTKLAEDTELVSLINSPTPNLPKIRQALATKLGRAFFDVNAQGFKTYSDKQAKALDTNEVYKPTEGDKKYARDTDNITAAAQQMYSSGELPNTLPGLTEIAINNRGYVINAELEAQQAAIAEGTLDKDDALSPEEISNKYPAPYYTLDLRPIKNIRQALTIAYGADENQIKSALGKLSNIEGYEPSKLLFSTTPLSTVTANGDKLPSLPPKNEVTQITQLRGEYTYGKNYLDSIEKLIDEAGNRIVAPRFRKSATKERNQKIQQIKELMQALKRDFPNLDLSDIKIPTTQQIS